MKVLIVCVSVSHGNTRRIAEEIAQPLAAPVVAPEELDPADLSGYDLVGFGSGVFTGRLHPRLRAFVRSLPTVVPSAERPCRAFVFATSGLPEPRFRPFTRPTERALAAKGFRIVDGFTARGHDTWLPFRLVGGISKHRPDTRDFAAARTFAEQLRSTSNPAS
ncbi:flavodoxin family protein [Kitasatospora sp. NPDC028055]|uniref:flavodoxin family protein n=1 Tax=Kitasatospora sp. NPDC028055 TaxID=3155653 RepID=UPI0033E3535B